MEALPYILIINGALLALFVAWIFASRAWQKLLWRLFPKRIVVPPFGATVRIKTPGAVYQSRFFGATPQGWAIESLADAIPTLRLGESVLAEITCPSGVVRFRTELVDMMTRHNATLMRPPVDTKLADRRLKMRKRLESRFPVQIDGKTAMLHDVGIGGARVSSNHLAKRGERVRLDVAGQEPLFGHVIDVVPNKTRGYSCDLRLLFEEQITPKDVKKKFAPAG
jgi:hypothetical protein